MSPTAARLIVSSSTNFIPKTVERRYSLPLPQNPVYIRQQLLPEADRCLERCGRMMASLFSRVRTGLGELDRAFQLLPSGLLSETTAMFAPATTLNRSFAAAGSTSQQRRRTRTPAKTVSATEPAKQKKPPTAYALFMKETFPVAKSANPTGDLGTLSKTVSAQWKQMTDTEKAR